MASKNDLRFMTAGEMADRTHVLLVPSTRPETPIEGWMYADATDHHLYYYTGTEWKAVDSDVGVIIVFPDVDPHVAGAGWWSDRDGMVFTRSNG